MVTAMHNAANVLNIGRSSPNLVFKENAAVNPQNGNPKKTIK